MDSEAAGEVASLLEALPHGALFAGPDGVVRAANEHAAAHLEVGRTELVGARLVDLMARRKIPGFDALLEEMTVGGVGRRDSPVTSAGRSTRVSVSLVRHADGQVMGTLAILEDITPESALRRRCEDLKAELEQAQCDVVRRVADAEHAAVISRNELQAANEELQLVNGELRERLQQLDEADRMNERKNEFLAMLAHELRNPLAPLVSALHLIRERLPGEPLVRQAMQIAERQVRHQTRLLDDLLDVSRLAAGKIDLERSSVDLTAIVRQAIEAADLSIRSNAHELVLDLPPAPTFVEGDATRLEQIVWNLLSNAVKYTTSGGRIGIRLGEREGQVILMVSDSGVGIAPDVLPRIFDLFVQGDASLARSQGGLGIGLTLVRRLVELHGGSVAARSAGRGRGSEFEVRLPVGRPHPAAGASRGGRTAAGRALRIVIIEDNRDAREMLRAVLELQGHQVYEAGDGATGVPVVITSTPDIVLLDIGLPGMDGYQVARRLRHRLGMSVRLIALTGYSDAETRRATVASGFDAHLVKPVDPDDLARVLATLA